VFYYGKDFDSKKQKLDKEGRLVDEDYKPLSVTDFGPELSDQLEDVAEGKKTEDNTVVDLLTKILGGGDNAATEDELQRIVKGE
jgi:hypothetical protein